MEPGTLLLGGWRSMELAADGISPGNFLLPRLEGRGPLGSYYAILAEELQLAGYTVAWPWLDWRQVLALDAQRLRAAILAYSAGGPVTLVCHSRGGLVARAAIALMEDAGELGALGTVVAMGTPHQGSWEAATMLGGWNSTVLLLQRLLLIGPGTLSLGYPVSALYAVVRTWPSTYELLPRPGARWASEADTAAAYDPAWWADGGAAVSAPWLAAARQRWEDLPTLTAAVRWYDVVGYGHPTPEGLTARPISEYGSLIVGPTGDGVVPEGSARQPGRVSVRVPVAHGALPYDGRAIGAAVACLRGEIDRDTTLEG